METQGSESIAAKVFDKLSRRSNSRRRYALRMAPMIDMVFLLLIFFLVTAQWRPREDFLPLGLPAARAHQAAMASPEPLEIYIFAQTNGCRVRIGADHTVLIQDVTIDEDLALMMEKIDRCLQDQKRFADDPIEIICGPEVKWEHLARIYNLFFGTGLTDITFRMTD